MSNLYAMTDTWNDPAITWTGIGLDITNTNSAAGSMLVNIKISGVSKFKVGLTGLIPSPAVATTLASAATIAPVNPIHFVSGVVAIATITAPALISATGGSITIIPTGIFTWTAAGNIALAGTAVVGKALTFFYDATAVKWYPSYT